MDHDRFLQICLLDGSPERMKCPDDILNAVLDDPRHFCFSSSPAAVISVSALIYAAPGDPDFDDITVNSSACAPLRDEQVQVKSLDGDKAESPGIAVNRLRTAAYSEG